MRFSHLFIDRPILAVVVNAFLVFLGLGALATLPLAQYPDIVPPTIQVTATYPGASADVVAKTVATPVEQQINGVENMLYMTSQSTGDGKCAITITFRLGTNLDTAQVLTQNRVTDVLPRLPSDVQHLGVDVRKSTPNMLLAVHLVSPNGTRDEAYLSNYATIHVRDVLSRLPGMGDVQIRSPRDYAMRIWLDPDRIATRGMTVDDVVMALRNQNIQVSSGVLNQPPVATSGAFQLNIQTLGRLTSPEQFGSILIKADDAGHVTRIRDIARVELGAADYGSAAFLDNQDAIAIAIYALPGANSLAVEEETLAAMKSLSKDFPADVAYRVVYDPTEFISQSVREVVKAIGISILLVVAVVFIFLRSFRAALIPIIAIPISLIGTFVVLSAFGFTLNNLSLFGIVLAVGIVVDDAIVVVENVERYLRLGELPKAAAHKTMDEVGIALIAIALTLCAVFLPSAFLSGITGQFFRQFAITIAASTIISCFVSLTLSPALCAVLFKGGQDSAAAPRRRGPARWFQAALDLFRVALERTSRGYAHTTARLVSHRAVMLTIYACLIALAGYQFSRAPIGFIPEQDQNYLITVAQLPPGASLGRTEDVVKQIGDVFEQTPGVSHAVAFSGLDATTFTQASNNATVFAKLAPFEDRGPKGLAAPKILNDLRRRLMAIKSALILAIAPPSVQGIGNSGGFKMMVEDRADLGPEKLNAAIQKLVMVANQDPALARVFTLFNTQTPSIYVDIDRERAEKLGLTPQAVFNTMQVYLGSSYINDFNYLGRTYEVIAQADSDARSTIDDITRLRARNAQGMMVPIGTVAKVSYVTVPYRIPHYNLFPAGEVQGGAAPGGSSETALIHMEQIARKVLPQGISYEWTDIAYQQRQKGTPTLVVFGTAALFVFLVLAAQYESLRLPLAVIMIVPMCLLAAVTGLLFVAMPVDILAQIGFVVLVGLAAKNAILIVEFARQAEEEGSDAASAAVYAACTRLRPILMTSLAFILGVIPLAFAEGAGAEMRRSLGTAVFFGMLGVTLFGLFFTPTFYTFVSRFGRKLVAAQPAQAKIPNLTIYHAEP